ncbi:hypothetical protein HD553DRAFT_353477 [Filobasidium floriforme]|uniref:uncharacterized protein n=1 Tax=Filobasidium floriforme TaxID=5210 RepID=UPI001E8D53C2|nr:uncharacterized protein HD553DRAFT_353477 [Filobasidium floriforme]KAH8090271.1 hypothetical protein HD553DRAFT_353477 [Filobasidium floriforme]
MYNQISQTSSTSLLLPPDSDSSDDQTNSGDSSRTRHSRKSYPRFDNGLSSRSDVLSALTNSRINPYMIVPDKDGTDFELQSLVCTYAVLHDSKQLVPTIIPAKFGEAFDAIVRLNTAWIEQSLREFAKRRKSVSERCTEPICGSFTWCGGGNQWSGWLQLQKASSPELSVKRQQHKDLSSYRSPFACKIVRAIDMASKLRFSSSVEYC